LIDEVSLRLFELRQDDDSEPVVAFNSDAIQAVSPLVGQVMRELKGADAKLIRELILKSLGQTP